MLLRFVIVSMMNASWLRLELTTPVSLHDACRATIDIESDDANFLKPNGQPKNLSIYAYYPLAPRGLEDYARISWAGILCS